MTSLNEVMVLYTTLQHAHGSSRRPNPDLLVLKVGYERRGVPHDLKPRPVKMRSSYAVHSLSLPLATSCCSIA